MVNGPFQSAFRAVFLALTLLLPELAGASGAFPFDRQLRSADAPLPGCRQAPVMTVASDSRTLHFRVCCNQISAPGAIEGDRIVFSAGARATLMYCGNPEAAGSEQAFMNQIGPQKQIRWRRENDLIVLETQPPLRFRIPPQ